MPSLISERHCCQRTLSSFFCYLFFALFVGFLRLLFARVTFALRCIGVNDFNKQVGMKHNLCLQIFQNSLLNPWLGCGWWEEDGASLCKHWKVIREGSYYKIGNLWLESVSSTKLGSGRQQRLKGEEMSKEKGWSNHIRFEENVWPNKTLCM